MKKTKINIVISGPKGSGKTVIIRMLSEALENKSLSHFVTAGSLGVCANSPLEPSQKWLAEMIRSGKTEIKIRQKTTGVPRAKKPEYKSTPGYAGRDECGGSDAGGRAE